MEKNRNYVYPCEKTSMACFLGLAPKTCHLISHGIEGSLIDAFARIIILPNCTKKLYTC